MSRRLPGVPGSPPKPKRELEVQKEGNARHFKPQPATPAIQVPPLNLTAYYQSRTPLVPTQEEITALPQHARVAFTERCILRVKPIREVQSVADAARVLFETATVDSPLTAQLRCIRRDFARLKRLAREQKWTDETPVPPDVFGPMWPEGIEPYWAVEPQPPAEPAKP